MLPPTLPHWANQTVVTGIKHCPPSSSCPCHLLITSEIQSANRDYKVANRESDQNRLPFWQ